MNSSSVGILHYSAPPVIGGVEAVIQAHVRLLIQAGYPTTVIAGRGDQSALPPGTSFLSLPEIDSQYPAVMRISADLEQGRLTADFDALVGRISEALDPVVGQFDHLIVHNIFGKHFNLPLTAALYGLMDRGAVRRCIAWGHDFSWTSPNSRSKVHSGYPWDLLRTQRADVIYIVVSQQRQWELAGLFDCGLEEIQVIYNGVDPADLLGLSSEGKALIKRLGLLESDLNLLMPVRVTQAKNIEYALRVVAALKGHGWKLKLVLSGPPDPHDQSSLDYYHSLQELRSDLGVDNEMRFVYESGATPEQAYTIDSRVVGDLMRVSDVMFMPSHREGFGMPVLEAGLAGVPVVSTSVPAAVEITHNNVVLFEPDQDPAATASQIIDLVESNPIARLRRTFRREYTWQAIFERQIEPLISD